MTMISYAQNFEDVMLWRCFKNIEKGFYIDVGANDPVLDSVSLAFYNKGWRGINIEPSTAYYQKLLEARADENNIQAALGAESGEIIFYDIPSTGLSTTDLEIACQHKNQGLSFTETKIKQIMLDEILADVNQDVHWLKIDVEGAEKQVLQGWQNSLIRPWVLIIESTLPRTDVESYEHWEKYVLNKGYQFVYFDGLNRFYVSEKHPELKQYFQTPPNVFDDFILKQFVDLKESVYYEKTRAGQINKQLDDVTQAFLKLKKQFEHTEKQLKHTEEQLHISNDYSKRVESQLTDFEYKISDFQNRLVDKHEELQHIKKKFEHSEELLNKTQVWGDSVHNRMCELEISNTQLESQINNILSSTSWKITFPLRQLKSFHNFQFKRNQGYKYYIKSSLNNTAIFINKYPKLHFYLVKTLKSTGLYEGAKKLRQRVFIDNKYDSRINNFSQNTKQEGVTDTMSTNTRRIFYIIEQEK